MGTLVQRSFKSFIGLVCLLNSNIVSASSRGTSFTRRTLGAQSLNQTSRDDFLLRYLKEMYQQHAKTLGVEDRGFLEWVPDGNLISAVPAECMPESFEQQAQQKNLRSSEYGQMAQDYFNHCGQYLSAKATGGLMGLIDFAMASYPFLENSRIRPLVFKTKDGKSVNGFIGIKDQSPRPWVIYKCGVFCAAETNAASLKNYMIHLFDQSPFNVILLGNRTGQDYIVTNKVFNFGGYFESQDFFDVAQWLRYESPYMSLVSSVHAVAVSLAGSAAYLTEQRLNSTESQNAGLFQSITSLCAVSDLRPTVENMYGDSLKGFIFSNLTWYYLDSVRDRLPGVNDLLDRGQPKSYEFPDLLGRLASRFMGDNAVNNPIGDDVEKARQQEFWQRSHYSAYNHYTKVPLFVWASQDDSVVDYNINTGNLMKVKSQRSDPNLGMVGVPLGEHCGFATAYGYSVAATMLRTFILNNSPEYSESRNQSYIPLNSSLPPMIKGERIISYWWSQGRSQSRILELNMEIYGADDSLCPEELIYDGAENCRRVAKIKFPENYFSGYGFTRASNLIEKEALVRELNGRTSLNFQGRNIVGSTHWPDQIFIRF